MEHTNEEFQEQNNASDEGQATVNEERYKNLQAEYTKVRQWEIALAVKLANKDKKSILEIEDKKLQEKVIKEIYGLNNLEEVKLIHWDTFYKTDEEKGDDEWDKYSSLEKEFKLMKFHQQKSEIEAAVEAIKKEQPLLFENKANEEKLIEELKYISTELPAAERVKRATSVLMSHLSPTDLWYLMMKEKGGLYVKWNDKKDEEEASDTKKEVSAIFGRYNK